MSRFAKMVLVLAAFFWAAVWASGCALSQEQRVLATERALEAGSASLDLAVDAAVEACRAKNLPDEAAREACVGPIATINDAATPVLEAAVAALRAYWSAKAAADETKVGQAVAALRVALEALPSEYFAGLQALGEKIR
jgi:hypothetical protein